jgi:hypothetical protein
MLKDHLIKRFYEDKLKLILYDNKYHSLKVSEMDEEDKKRKIVIKDLRWRSSTVSI